MYGVNYNGPTSYVNNSILFDRKDCYVMLSATC